MLTVNDLDRMAPKTIFASGIGLIEHPWFNDATPVSEGGSLEEDGRNTKVKWVAMRGQIHDWAIYHSMDANLCKADFFDSQFHLALPDSMIADHGAKLYDRAKIKEFVPCDDEAFKLYRF